MQKNKVRPLTPCIKINSKWTIDQNVRAENIELLGENMRVNLCGFGLGKAFLEMTLKAQVTK